MEELNRNQFLILMSLYINEATDKYHGMTLTEIMDNTGNNVGRMYMWRLMKKLKDACYDHADTYYLLDKGITVCKGEN